MNVSELKQLAKERNIPGYYKLKKAELIQALGSEGRARPSPRRSPKKQPKQSLARKSPAKTVRKSPARTARKSPTRTARKSPVKETPLPMLASPPPELLKKKSGNVASFKLSDSQIRTLKRMGGKEYVRKYPYPGLDGVYDLYEMSAAEKGEHVSYNGFAKEIFEALARALVDDLDLSPYSLDIDFTNKNVTIKFLEDPEHPFDPKQLDGVMKEVLVSAEDILKD
jgi:hypothetical protein